MDYYLIPGGTQGVLAEEFLRRKDFTTAGLRSSDAGLSRRIRAEPGLTVVPVGGEQVAGSPPLVDYEEFPAAPMLLLSAVQPLPGFREKRLYRVLFARVPEQKEFAGDIDADSDSYSWRLRSIGKGVAWCLDVTAHLNDGTTLGPVLGRLTDLMRLDHGLIPVTTERLQ